MALFKVESLNDSTRTVLAILVVGGLVVGYFVKLTPSEVMAGLGGTAMGYWFGTEKKKADADAPAPPPPPTPTPETPKP